MLAMRVLYCTDTYPPQVNGVSVVTALTVAGMRARGWDVEILAPRYPTASASVFAATVGGGEPESGLTTLASVPLPFYPEVRVAMSGAAVARDIVARFRPDLVHCETEFLVGKAGQAAALGFGVPCVTSYHTDFSKYARSYRVPWLAGAVSRSLIRFHGRAARTYTPSQPSRDELLRGGVRDVEVWGRGVDAERFNPGRRSAALRARMGIDDTFTFLYVGRLAREKGVDVVLDAFRRVREALGTGVRLVVAGEGPAATTLRAAAPRGTVFLGNLHHASELPVLYASADAFVFASVTETLGLVVLEAMASGLAVVATPAGGVVDHLRPGENGLAFPAHDAEACAHAMMQLVSDRALLHRLRAGARRTAEALNWEAELDRLHDSYGEVVTGYLQPVPQASRSAAIGVVANTS